MLRERVAPARGAGIRVLLLLGVGLVLGACTEGDRRHGAHVADTDADFYSPPPLAVEQLRITEGEGGSPREILLFIPQAAATYPLLQFQHGFVSDVDTYTELLGRLAGFGFVVAAPQMYGSDPSNAPPIPEEAAAAVQVLNWLQGNLNAVLAARTGTISEVQIAADATGLLGHSRGGQVAWRMLFDVPGSANARAIAGIDPVDGDAPPFPPGGTGELVTDDPGAFDFPFASLIIGMGRGAEGVPGFECAPENRNYTLFYEASAAPRYEVVATDYGHSDMLNGNEPSPLCVGAVDGTREQLRIFVAGQLAAYFLSTLTGADQRRLLRDSASAPIAVNGRFDD